MNYWHMQLHSDDAKWEGEEELLREKSLIGLGDWEDKRGQVDSFKKIIKVDDIVLIKRGNKALALVQVTGDVEDTDNDIHDNLDWFRYRRKIKVLAYAKDYVNQRGNFPQARGTLQKSIGKETDSYKYIDKWYSEIIKNRYSEEDRVDGSYKIKEIFIEDNKKQFKNFTINFTSEDNKILPLIIIAGRNGVGKTELLKYLSNLDIQKNDYIKIVSMDKASGIDTFFHKDDILVQETKITHNMIGITANKKEYNQHIEYLPVEINKIEDVKKFIIEKIIKKSIEIDSHKEALKELQNFIKEIFDGMDIGFNIDSIKYADRDNEKVYFIKNNGKSFEINSLSTGEKTLLSKVLYLYFKDIKNKIILIDEPELSLHPDWQNRVLKLYENFAINNNCQIIMATHSPHIIGSAKHEYLRVLDKDSNGDIKVLDSFTKSYGLEFNKILTDIMGVNNLRTPSIDKDFKFIKKEIYSNNYKDNPKFIKTWEHLEDNLESNNINLNNLRNDFELIKKIIFTYENVEKEEFQEVWDRLERNLGKNDLDLKLLRFEMKMRNK